MYTHELPPGHTFKFDKTERKMDISDTPGPGYYKLPCKVADVPRYNKTIQEEEFRWV